MRRTVVGTSYPAWPCRARELAAAFLVVLMLHGTAAAAPLRNLGWVTGVACGGPQFAAWLGRPSQVQTLWAPQRTWREMVGFAANLRQFAGSPRTSIGLPLVTAEDPGAFGRCAGGAFDGYFRAFARSMAHAGLGELIVRPGWEANGDWFPWAIGDKVEAYKGCFRHVATLFRNLVPGVKIEWAMDKHGRLQPAIQAYPGDAYVDYVGVSYYDRYPPNRTEAEWNAQVNNTLAGSPYGIGAWLQFARAHGKRLAVSEWGISKGYASYEFNRIDVGTDNALFISRMFWFFRAHRADIAYETYFNCDGENPAYYKLQPPDQNPRAAKRYRQLWGNG